jgi:hypothetical protein
MHKYCIGMMYSAASVGSDEVLQWLRDENRVQYDVTLLRAAAAHYQLSTVQYLRSQGCALGRLQMYV